MHQLVDGARTIEAIVNDAEVAPVRSQLLLAEWLANGDLEIIPASDLPVMAEACLPNQPSRGCSLGYCDVWYSTG